MDDLKGVIQKLHKDMTGIKIVQCRVHGSKHAHYYTKMNITIPKGSLVVHPVDEKHIDKRTNEIRVDSIDKFDERDVCHNYYGKTNDGPRYTSYEVGEVHKDPNLNEDITLGSARGYHFYTSVESYFKDHKPKVKGGMDTSMKLKHIY